MGIKNCNPPNHILVQFHKFSQRNAIRPISGRLVFEQIIG